MTKFRLTVGYRSWMLNAADASKVMEILSGATLVDNSWVDGECYLHVSADPVPLTLTVPSEPVLTLEAFDRMVAKAKKEEEA